MSEKCVLDSELIALCEYIGELTGVEIYGEEQEALGEWLSTAHTAGYRAGALRALREAVDTVEAYASMLDKRALHTIVPELRSIDVSTWEPEEGTEDKS